MIRFFQRQIDNPGNDVERQNKRNYEIVTALASGRQTPDDSSRYVGRQAGDWGGPRIESSRKFGTAAEGERLWTSSIRLEEYNAATASEFFQRAVRESINMTESPNKKLAEEAAAKKQIAVGATTMIGSLPPRE